MSVRIQVFVKKGHVTILSVAIIANVILATEEETAIQVGVCYQIMNLYVLVENGYTVIKVSIVTK